MTPFIITNSEGTIVRSGAVANPADIDIQPLGPGESITPGLSGRAGRDRLNASGEIEPIPPAVPTLAEQKAALLARLAERRWQVETGGITFEGARIETDDRAKLLLASAAGRARANPAEAVRWKVAPGNWVDLDAATIIDAETAVYAHVQACFAREAEITDMINDADEITPTLQAVVEDFWPV